MLRPINATSLVAFSEFQNFRVLAFYLNTIKLQPWPHSDLACDLVRFAAFRDIQGILDSPKIFVPGSPRVLLLAKPLHNHTSGNPA